MFSGGAANTRPAHGDYRRRRNWKDGWARDEFVIPDPKGDPAPGARGDGLREVAFSAGKRWRDLHEKRRVTVRRARKAAYVQRHRWARDFEGMRPVGPHMVEDWRYREGPCEGLQAVDLFRVAKNLQWCGAARNTYGQLRWSPEVGLLVLPQPRLCGLKHTCPVCAALRSHALATALRSVVDDETRNGVWVRDRSSGHRDPESRELRARWDYYRSPGALVFMTLTQRARRGEPMAGALWRLRRAWRQMTGDTYRGRRFKDLAPDGYQGLETTYGYDAARRHWHVHAHVVLRLAPGVDPDVARAKIGAWWRDCSAAAAEAVGLPGYGWDPVAGMHRQAPVRAFVPWFEAGPVPVVSDVAGCEVFRYTPPEWRPRVPPHPEGRTWGRWADHPPETVGDAAARHRAGDWSGPWFQCIDPSDLSSVYQACKYPTPISDLRPAQLAEFVSVAHGRRWHQGWGRWLSALRLAEELEQDAGIEEGDDERIDIGEGICDCAPGQVPQLDTIAPGLGMPGEERPPWAQNRRFVAWALLETQTVDDALEALAPLVEHMGFELAEDDGRWWLWGPSAWAGRSAREIHAAIAASRDGPVEDAARPPPGCPLPPRAYRALIGPPEGAEP